ncbi:hypothetical protein COW36_07305 [bacterium (Candidatus Blackallbacteria) CG17_big_fil_post_rev_8_21_14_2_50_48_46]|uniref:Uncharacterized protein n=1 Tax=bacterium (Candidatus Blackallbacteria) CG17_big_fil_post_rev_8_21_14_2_50_48_46 TaxID=2014261 RepID=A0A2M7G736_9BACT|nr:MAG: hypothetical protein COW64_06815 [bacterium (Candidatus Blackallbacteria) CG18_big_fil_WC_8_21_14_2_50_49_26]PIW17869.1 MAG: hypothetical protein COW36_07305 [bacterium (Candidatus Blackallbacteria) CG17_big_fil_post_rev_8_21_14_2_50_48_46]PIW48545.1 MAG: hypothetical protein COW20_09260 [bacterium (Candidatus Blackallbacteria) CG13_big_fil_rev_8_21_14_2_50_49_14]
MLTEEDPFPLAEGPVESVEPFVNPPVDSGYHPPPLEPVPFVDPFAGLVHSAEKEISELFAKIHVFPWQLVQSAHKKLMSMPSGHPLKPAQRRLLEACLNPKADALAFLKDCSLDDLGGLAQALQELGRRKMPMNPSPQLLQEQQALQYLYQIIEAECLARNL